jgi:hypothetical protein
MLKIGVLPPRSVTLLEVDVSAINEANVTTHVRSDDVVGYHNSLLTSIVYGVVLIPIVAIVIYKALPQKRQEQISKRIIQARDYMESNLPPRKKDGPNKVSDNAGWPILKK